VRGLNEKKKRRDLFTWLRKRKYDICLLQESHCTKNQETLWQNEWGYKAYFSSHCGNSRGVITLFNNTFQFELHKMITDQDGRFLLMDCVINDAKITIANIYGPNEDEPQFFERIHSKLEQFENNSIIWGGDYNVVQDYVLDTLNLNKRNNPNSHQQITDIKKDLDLIDPWREENPETRTFTWHNSQNKQSRLDYFLISSDIMHYVEKTYIKAGYRSDHSIVELFFKFDNQKRGPGLWKFNNSLLKDDNYTKLIKTCIKDTKEQYKVRNVLYPNDHSDNFTINSQLLFETIKLEIEENQFLTQVP